MSELVWLQEPHLRPLEALLEHQDRGDVESDLMSMQPTTL